MIWLLCIAELFLQCLFVSDCLCFCGLVFCVLVLRLTAGLVFAGTFGFVTLVWCLLFCLLLCYFGWFCFELVFWCLGWCTFGASVVWGGCVLAFLLL